MRNFAIFEVIMTPYFQRRGPQRSVDVIVSAAFILTLLFLGFLSAEWLNDSVQLHSQYNLEALIWSCALGCFLLRFMTLGTKINRKYRSISVLITEQINLYLQVSTHCCYTLLYLSQSYNNVQKVMSLNIIETITD